MSPTNQPLTVDVRCSAEWCEHFRQNLAQQRIDWSLAAQLGPVEHPKLIRSVQAWQRGETSDGSHLLRATGKYVTRFGDLEHVARVFGN